jgi:uncharacterized protein YndB with AHSA1/START domain
VNRAEHTVVVARPPAEVFPYLLEPDLMRRWIGGLVEFTPVDDAPRVGARSRQKVEQAGRTWDVDSEIVELVPDRRLAARATSSAFASTLSYALEPVPEGTRLHGTVETRLRGITGRLLGGVAARAAERKLVADLGRLKRLLDDASA